jgi:putative transposon-encoded protein
MKQTKLIKGRVSAFGNGAHIIVPKKWIGKKVHVFLNEKTTKELLKGLTD